MEDLDLLMELGLTKAEAKIYMTLLKYGPLTAGKIVTLSRQHISVTYAALQRLVEKGYVSYIRKGKFNEYSILNPEIFDRRMKELTGRLEPRLKAWKEYLASTKYQTKVQVFEGMKGLANIINQMLKTAKRDDKWRSFTLGKENENPEVLAFFKKINETRLRLGVNARAICNSSYKDVVSKIGDPHHLKTAHLRFVAFEFPQGIITFQDNVLFVFWSKDPIIIHIKDSRLADEYGKFFDKLYATGEPYRPLK